MAADEQKVFEQTILNKIAELSSDRDIIANGLNAKGLNIPEGSTFSEIAVAASDTTDDYVIKASPTQFGQVKLISSSEDNGFLSSLDSTISTLALSSPYVIPAKKNYNILSGIHNDLLTLNEIKLNTSYDSAQNLTVTLGQLKGVDIKTYGVGDSATSSTFEGIIKNSLLSNVSFDLLSGIDIVSSNVVNSQIDTTTLIDTNITKVSEIKHLPIGNKALINGYYGTLANLGYTSEDCSVEDGKFYPVKISICKRNDDTYREQNQVPIYTRILKRNSTNDAWELLYQSYNSIVIRTYNLLCGANNCLMGPLYLSGSEPIDLTSNIAITFTSSLSEPFDQTTFQLPVATTVVGGGYNGVFTGNISSGVPSIQDYSPILAIQGKNTKNYTEDLIDLVQKDISSVEQLELSSNELNTKIENLSTNLSAIPGRVTLLETSATTLSTNLSAIPDKVNEIEETLSTKSSIKIGEGLNNTLSSTGTLNIRKVSPEEYAELLATQTTDILSNEMYIISADYLIGFDNKIVDVADGTEPTDAATFGQLSALSNEVAELKRTVQTLSEQIDQLTATA